MIYLLDTTTRDKVLASLAKLDASKRWDISVEPHKDRRSLEQNKRLWLLHEAASEVTGYTSAEMHEFALCRFYGYEDRKVGEITLRFPRKRSSTRDKKEFREFMDNVENWYVENLGVWLPT